jgi:butyrate kinase
MSEAKNFLVINPGSTSTKVALYRGIDSWNIEEIESRNLRHSPEDLEGMSEPIEQLELRRNAVEDFLTGSDIRELHAVAGRGGLTRPIEAGSYRVNEALKEDLRSARYGNHASNLGPSSPTPSRPSGYTVPDRRSGRCGPVRGTGPILGLARS